MRLGTTLALSSDEQAEIYRGLGVRASFGNPWRRSMGRLRRHDPTQGDPRPFQLCTTRKVATKPALIVLVCAAMSLGASAAPSWLSVTVVGADKDDPRWQTVAEALFCRTRFHALTRFSRLHTSSINCSVTAELSGAGFATNGSAPW